MAGMRTTRRMSLVLALALPASAAAIDIAWYQQRVPGNASGEMRLENLGEGDLEIETPGLRMEFGILRIGDVAIVNLAEPEGRSAREDEVRRELVVVARQGNANTRAIYPLAVPAPEVPKPPATATRSVPISAALPSTVAEEPVAPADVDRLEVNEGSRAEDSPVTRAPKIASLAPGLAMPTKPSVCPVLAIRPGSLRANIDRLLGECGALMGEWVTGGAGGEYLTDWVVREPRILAERNRDGLQGLLELLYAHYRLQGLPSAETAAIDIYKTE